MLLICKNCNKEYEWINGKSKKFCCMKCIRQWKKDNIGKEEIHTCLNCNKEYKYILGQKNWNKENKYEYGSGTVDSKKFCCYECGITYKLNKTKKTNIKKYGVEYIFQAEEVKQKSKQTCLERYGVEYSFQSENNKRKSRETSLRRYGVDNPAKSEEIKERTRQNNLKKYGVINTTQLKSIQEKIQKTCLERYGERFFTQSHYFRDLYKNKEFNDKIQKQVRETKIKNHTQTKSFEEESIYQLLLKKFPNTINHYTDEEKYPFNCDFYIPELDLYIEYQGTWLHGKEPYDENNEEHRKQIELWKNQVKKQYKQAIYVWTISDPHKRQTAKKNNLNYLEFFSIEEFYEWYNKI